MSLIAVCIVVFSAVYASSIEAELSIRVSYTSIYGEAVSYELGNGDTGFIEISTENVYYTCIGGTFNHTQPGIYLDPFQPYSVVNTSTYHLQVVYNNIDGFTKYAVCMNGTVNITANLAFSGFGLLWTVGNGSNEDFFRLAPGGILRVNSQSNYRVECLSAYSFPDNPLVQLFRPNGSNFTFYSNLSAAPADEIFALGIQHGWQLRLAGFFSSEDQGEYRCVNADLSGQPVNLTFTLYSSTQPCNLTTCPEFSFCNESTNENLCRCQFTFLEYRNAICQCPLGYALNDTSPPFQCYDVDECDLPLICGNATNITCVNSVGSFKCVNICVVLNCSLLNNRSCQRNASGGYSCECIAGYSPLNSTHCSPNFTLLSSHSIPPTRLLTSSSIFRTVPISSAVLSTHSIHPTPSPTQSSSIFSLESTNRISPTPTPDILTSMTTSFYTPTPTPTSTSSQTTTPSPTPESIDDILNDILNDIQKRNTTFTPAETTALLGKIKTLTPAQTTIFLRIVETLTPVQTTAFLGKIETLTLNQTTTFLRIVKTLTPTQTTTILGIVESTLNLSLTSENISTAIGNLRLISTKIANISKLQTRTFMRIIGNVTSRQVLSEINNDIRTEIISDILDTVDNIAMLLAPVYFGSDLIIVDNENIRMEVRTVPVDGSRIRIGEGVVADFSLDAFRFCKFKNCSEEIEIKNCSMGNCTLEDCQTIAVSVEFKNINEFIEANFTFQSWFCVDVEMQVLNNSGLNQSVNTNVFSFNIASVNCKIDTFNLSQPIRITFQIQNPSLASPSCVSLRPEPMGALTQDQSNCETIPSATEGTLTCSCDHLTSFAILMSPSDEYQSSEAMAIATYTCLSVSILSLIIALLIYTFVKFKVSIAIFFVHYNLMVSVLLSEIVFLVGIDRSEFNELCLVVSAVLHYILLVSFLWMFFEVFNLLVLILRPSIGQKKIIHLYWPLAYGLPFIVVAFTVGLSFCNYGSYYGSSYPHPMSTNCWLPRRNGNYWAFIGPALFIVLVNAVLVVVLCVRLIQLQWKRMSYRASALHTSKSKTLAVGFMSAIRASLLLLPMVGFTWIFGVFAINSADSISLVFQWLFILFNGLQGFFIFIFYCLLKTEVRDAFLLLLLRKVCRKEIRLVEGETLFSTMKRKSSNISEIRGKQLTDSCSSARNSRQDINLIPISPAKKISALAFSNPSNSKS